MNNISKVMTNGVKTRRGRARVSLSERLTTFRGYPRIGTSELTGVLR